MIEHISDLRLFVAITNTLNFREAGDKLGYSAAVVSSRMKRLEVTTGKTLFIRSTRQVKLTEEGREFLQTTEKLLGLAESLSAKKYAISEAALSGIVRIASPHSFARLFLLKPICELMQAHPGLIIELILEDSLTELVREGVDISFRIGAGELAHFDSYTLMPDSRIFIASPQYLDASGEPEKPHDIIKHRCLCYRGSGRWLFTKDSQSQTINLKNIMYCNTGDFLSKLAQEGLGITVKSAWSVAREIETGKLVHILKDYTHGADSKVQAILPKRDYTPERVNLVLRTITEHIARNFYPK